MRTTKRTTKFKRDYRREEMGRHKDDFKPLLSRALELLTQDLPLPSRYNDHPLKGKYKGLRECHLKPDFLLVYRKPKPDLLELVRLGSHSELELS
ncbi:MAG: type II toxin-antitoxin system YafQ family toxin [Candidatus Symbiobacter sp.]|nr:type II toxin-antitoxin system YafQ family toxin [Candidatus Symbiobacter sp.]